MRTRVEDVKHHVGEVVTLYLTLDVLRDQKNLQFLLAHDATGKLQLVVDKSSAVEHACVSQLLTGSTFAATGKIIAAAQSKTFGVEMQVLSVEVFSKAQPFPITEASSVDLRFNARVVDLKVPKWQLMLRLRSAFEFACREFALGRGLTELHTPKLMGNASESGAQVFRVGYFDTEAYLAQSPQFYKQMGIASGLEGVFEIGPVFRAEESRSSRHMTEFTGLDVELAWVFETAHVMTFEEQMLRYAFAQLQRFAEEVKTLFGVDLPLEPTATYLSLSEAKRILGEHGMPLGPAQDLPDEGESLLYKVLGCDLIFVSDYPIAKRPFYHQWNREQGVTKSFDLIFKGIEITTGAVREHRYDVLCEQAVEKGVDLASITHYLDNFRYGCAPHGGFGLGVERVIMKLLGLSNVKEAAFVPRDPERLVP
ncbi:lysyl-tRNA synthetase [Pandoraea communis]|uniref:Lysyl-tRNA synthetase n=1 Tax=Pandoraea communis TaxID=2508297 RepID=A0A5E4SD56_9BURK|nr:aspartate--tRNA(Asn) ligase [Pandoraea communis]VVD73205.1 lysyl-tRNA synthetase [Pandoraea communis]